MPENFFFGALMTTAILMYLIFGAFAGLLAGLLGVGGGLIIVPILVYGLPLQGITDPNLVHRLALGTSLASIIFTSISSVRAHSRRGTVMWPVVLRFAPGIVAGTAIGGSIAALVPTKPLATIFVLFLCYVSIQMLLDIKPKASRHLPETPGLVAGGGIIGFVSSFVGIGGGSLTIPFLTFCNVPMREAIGTSAGVGFPIAFAGAVTYIATGWAAPGLPEHAVGFVYLPALAGLVTASMLTAPLGAKIAYKLPISGLKKFFALFLLFVACNMVYKLFFQNGL